VLFKILVLALGLNAFAIEAFAKEEVIQLANGQEIVANFQKSQKSTTGEVFVLLNGLVYELNRWDNVANGLEKLGHTVIRYSYSAQPANLRRLKKDEEPAFFTKGLTPEKMAEELSLVLEAYGVTGKIHLVGLSYGSSVAAAFAERNPERIEDVTFMSPLVVPTDAYDARSAGLRAWLESVRYWENAPCSFYGAFNPFLCSAQDYWYDAFYKSLYETYLMGKVSNIPQGVEASVYKKSLFHLIRAARDFDLKKAVVGLKNVSLFVASEDDKPLRADQELAWEKIPVAERRAYVRFNGARHALPDEAPARVISLLDAIAKKEDRYSKGEKYEVPADR
jgi:pimeloyl-ACP methyl ester carboxylesterase